MTTTTTNYGWVKPDVGASDDVWGGYINTDLDGIDTIVKGVSVVANAAYPASNPSGYQTAAQVASVVIGDNRIINGDMRIDQRNTAVTSSGFTVDRWQYGASVAAKGSAQRQLNSVCPGFPNALIFTSSSAYTPAAAETFYLMQTIEADAVSDFQWGSANAQPVTLSFWAFSTIGGTLSGAIVNFAGTRSYPFTFTLPLNAWTKVAVTIPGDTSGAWVMSGNGGSISVRFDLGSGASFRGPANAWGAGNLFGANGAVNTVTTNGAAFVLTGVKLEIGSVATPFNRQSLAKSLADCQRYFYSGVPPLKGISGTTTAASRMAARHPATMRAAPMLTMTAGLPLFDGGTAIATSIATSFSTTDVLELDLVASGGGLTSQNPVGVYQGAGGNLQVSAEL